MKKFTRILICLLLCVFSFSFASCDNRSKKEKAFTYPKSSDEVYGNGGLAVRKGNHVYYVNGYKSINGDGVGKKASYSVGSLMLMRLGSNGEVVTDENGLVKDEYFITMSSKLCGYEATNIFVFGNYLYFVTPCLENETGDKVWAKERVEFKRIKLDKTSKVETIYKSGVKLSNLEFKYYEENGSLNLLVWEKGDSYYENYGKDALIRVNASNGGVSKVANGVTSVAFANNASEIFFVQNSNNEYNVKKYDVVKNESTPFASFESSVEIKFVQNGKVYLVQTHKNLPSYKDLMVADFANGSTLFKLFLSNVSDYQLSLTDDGAAVIAVKSNVIDIISTNQNYEEDKGAVVTKTINEDSSVTKINVIGYTNGCILYYTTTSDISNIKLVSYSNAITGGNTDISTLTSIDVVEEDYAYFDLNEEENNLYFYKKVNNDYYLHRLNVNSNQEVEEEMFGVYDSDDVPEIEKPEEEIEE